MHMLHPGGCGASPTSRAGEHVFPHCDRWVWVSLPYTAKDGTELHATFLLGARAGRIRVGPPIAGVRWRLIGLPEQAAVGRLAALGATWQVLP